MSGTLNDAQYLFLHALRTHLGTAASGAQTAFSPPTLQQLAEVFSLAREHKVLPMVYSGLVTAFGRDVLHQLLGVQRAADLRREVHGRVIGQTAHTCAFCALYREMEESGFAPLVVKGAVCRALYPSPDQRPSSDEDLLVPKDLFFDILHFLCARGARALSGALPQKEDGVLQEFGLVFAEDSPYSGLYLELHTALFSGGDGMDAAADALFCDAHETAVRADIGEGTAVQTLCPQLHLLYLILHALKHFVHTGFGIRQICDIALFACRYAEVIDFDALYDTLHSLRAARFAAAVFACARVHLGISVPLGTLWDAETCDELPLLLDVLSGGIWGGTDTARVHSVHLTLSATGASSPIHSIFPPVSALRGRYPYLQKHPWLLPAAWCARIAGYFGELAAQKTARGADPAQSVHIGRQRVRLMTYYGITRNGK